MLVGFDFVSHTVVRTALLCLPEKTFEYRAPPNAVNGFTQCFAFDSNLWVGFPDDRSRSDSDLAVSVHSFRPEPYSLERRPRGRIPAAKFPIQPILQIRAVVDHIALIDREYRIACLTGFCRKIAMAKERNQLRRFGKCIRQLAATIRRVFRPRTPFRPPELIMLHVEQETVERPV